MARKSLIPFYFLISASSAYQDLCTTAQTLTRPPLFSGVWGGFVCNNGKKVCDSIRASHCARDEGSSLKLCCLPGPLGRSRPQRNGLARSLSQSALSLRLRRWTECFSQARLVCVYPKWLLCHKCRIWRRRWVRGVVSLLDVWPLDSVLICFDYPLMKGPNVSAWSQRALVRESEGVSLAGSFCPDFHPAATWDTRNLAAHTH